MARANVGSALRRTAAPFLVSLALIPPALDVFYLTVLPPPGPSLPADYVERFAGVRDHLPPGVLVGYVFDPADFGTLEQVARDPGLARRVQRVSFAIFLAQQALAPHLCRIAPEADYQLGDFVDAAHLPPPEKTPGLEVVADFGNGVILWKKKGK